MAADDAAGSFVTSNVTATNETGWTDATPALITGHKLNGHNAVTTMVSDPTSAHVAQSGNFPSAMTTTSTVYASWIVDSGASDHMTGNASLFSTLAPCASSLQVKIADGTMAKVSAIGSIKISTTLTLMNVLYVPALACNLLSISKLTQDNNYCATFRAHDCVFQDLASEKMIGNAKEYNGLYILGSTHIPTFNKIVLSANCPSNILLWHYRCEPIQQSQNTRDSLEPIQQSQNTQDKMFGIVYTRRQETQEKETTPMMQIHDSLPSPTEPESTSEGLNLPIALRKGVLKSLNVVVMDIKWDPESIIKFNLGVIPYSPFQIVINNLGTPRDLPELRETEHDLDILSTSNKSHNDNYSQDNQHKGMSNK
ncbi:Retrovirus-related Pol polyprotein from transposon TNT 1-94 [Senna tora]|uniref:Retrovirus-related Pol polyprotein from transposon TNT 1-94 n=1 Tax=Senna tora TaxID=362788 RepID=A0A834T3C8_9FABA|nr:Retrovirus-related Pol polyprotein from transposon TNT 1-94 [Senna tora]